MSRVLVAMSGGVDSSAAALLLRDEGHEVVGCTMQLWDYRRNPTKDGQAQFGRCCSLDDVYDARRVAESLGFPFYVLNLEEEFERRVVEPFIGNYLEGRTPSPCILCNTFLKFDRLLHFARQIGVEKVATGHYVRLLHEGNQGYVLKQGKDLSKDQSYFLFEINQLQLQHLLFPLGNYEKDTIRKIALDNQLVTANKRDSQEICFVPDRDYAGFIRRHAVEVQSDFELPLAQSENPGPILFKDGTRLGTHQGLFNFTVGQRRGLGISHSCPLYVLRLDTSQNTVIVGYREDLLGKGFIADKVSWVAGQPPGASVRASVKVRSRHQASPARIVCEATGASDLTSSSTKQVRVTFDSPQMSLTPGQAAVFYRADQVLGGGWIRQTF